MWICFFTIPLQHTPVFHVSFIFVVSSPYLSAVTPCDSGILLRLSSPVHHRSLCYALRVCVCVFACVSASLSVCLFGCICCFVSVCVKFHRAVKLQIFQLNYLYSANKHSHVLAFLLWGSSLTLSKIHTPLTWARTLLLTHQQASEENEDQKWSSLCISKKNILHQSSKRKKAQKYKWSQIPSFFLFVDRFIDRTEGVNYGLLN